MRLSIEKEVYAHTTLELRCFFHQFRAGSVPQSYYEFAKGAISRAELFDRHPVEARSAKAAAWQLELSAHTDRQVSQRSGAPLDGRNRGS